MAKPQVVEDCQLDHMLKATAGSSRTPDRDVALLLVLYGTALNVSELAKITVADYITTTGSVKVASGVRAEIAHNGEARPLYWSNNRVTAAVDRYLLWRVEQRHGATKRPGVYRSLNSDSPLFLSDCGEPYALTKRTQPSGHIAYSCNALGKLISRLHENSGIEGGSAQSARRTLAVKLHRQGYDIVHIATILGHKSVTTTQRLVGQDSVRLADIVANAV